MEILNRKITLINRIISFMEGTVGGVATLKEIYSDVKNQFKSDEETLPNNFEEKVRCVIYRDSKLKRVTKGVYMYSGENTAGLIIHGDGRKLDEIEDGSIDLIITDHAWSDAKAHKSGNQKNFAADYENTCFRYEESDFIQKSRVMKKGAYLVECLPTESSSNYEYLYEIKKMAKKAGFEYYAKLMWMKAPEGTINTGKTTKGIEDIMIFTKGKPRRLSQAKKPYLTKSILPGRLDIPAPKPKEKRHQAEKPVSLYSYLIEAMSEENDVLLDQFGGSCNMVEAAVKKNRFAIVYEYLKKFIMKAVNRLGAVPLYIAEEDVPELNSIEKIELVSLDEVLGHNPEVNVVVVDSISETNLDTSSECIDKLDKVQDLGDESFKNTNDSELTDIPDNIVLFQKELLLNLSNYKPNLFSKEDMSLLNLLNIDSIDDKHYLNKLFQSIYDNVYENHYKRIIVDFDLFEQTIYDSLKAELDFAFVTRIENDYVRSYYKNYLIEAEDFIKFKIKKCGATTITDIKENLNYNLDKYLSVVGNHSIFKNKDLIQNKTMILKLLA